ncbi:sulfate ABC transporter permease subunit CysW [Ferrovibrio sp.]|uniref:sulfate ABC transporter permease subunit CysW n=1 Tax=Ferrovibrio sp. TaxID=1917215 RepID=UPI001B5C87C8|nr:sulfate ABC transporter permease subunit CysW [Ferrovibrio sp.]MBP7063656.1 sulfate ABC transporter permease subunit CysW [Ferrovibrio sp.]
MSTTRRNLGPLPLALIALGLLLSAGFVLAPILVIFSQAFSKGVDFYLTNVLEPDTLHAMGLTILTAIVVVPVNILFGIAAAWAIAKFDFVGKKLLLTLLEIPFSISPIVAGVTYILLYGAQGLFGGFLEDHGIRLMFALPAIFLVTLFVTSPFVARELIPLMQAQGTEPEEAAATLGASGWQIFRRVTLPSIRWALLYGAVLCTARAIGEFGAVSVVSGNVRGETNTLPLHVELLYHDYNAVGAFAAATTLTVLALVTLLVKAVLESKIERR